MRILTFKIVEGILTSAMFVAVIMMFAAFSPTSVSDYVLIFPAVLGFITGYFGIFNGEDK